jgi:uncharacterized protein (TIGR00251 family)
MRFNVKVIPNAKQNRIVAEPGRLKVYLTAPPVDGKANRALIELLAEHFNVKRSAVRILCGETGREKVAAIFSSRKI